MISVLVWNVRGIGNISSIRRLRKLVSLYLVSLLIFQEPFVSNAAASEISQKLGFSDCVCSDNNKLGSYRRIISPYKC